MNAASPEVDPLPSRVPFKFHFPYRPSNLLCSALIFWTVLCLISELILPFLALIFTITIYGPTIYFAARCIRQTSRGTYEPADSEKMGKTAAILCVLWVLIIPTHVYVKWIEPKYSEVFLIPVLPGSQAIILMLYIALRYTMEKRARRWSDLAITPTEEEAPPAVVDAESQPLLGSDSQFNIYRPSKILLVVSILFAFGSWAIETLHVTWGTQHKSFAVVLWFLWIWLYVPLIQLQLFTLKRAFRRYPPTLVEEGGIGNRLMDLAAMFVGMKPLIILYTAASTQYTALLYVPGFIQECLVVYNAVRYGWSFSKVIPRYEQANSTREADVGDAVQSTVPKPVPVPAPVPVPVSEPVPVPVPESVQTHDTTSASSTHSVT
ncbi:hypothetical protein D9619_012162 [Psilocybe cf. subviscida]|uniref:Uncharacterized protein n=1 Tax=Psilocybe cf. subviscida TaxID=2480587 RepID=A0A8H5B7L1_9AGAR|nr:hypothetical protein D9619_012162 [Psilocybe cf. subviscida]